MRGLYESILDDEATILSRSDRDADLLLWSDILFGSGMLNKGQFCIKPGSTKGKFKLEYFGKEYTPIHIKFLSERLYKSFREACEGIYIYAQNMIEMMIGFDFDFSTLPHFYDLEGDGYDDPFRTSTTHINLANINSAYTLHNLNPENLGINKKTTLSTTLKIFNPAKSVDVTFKDFRWDAPYAKVVFENIHIKKTRHIELPVKGIISHNVDVDNTADDETKEIGILSHLHGSSEDNNIIDSISFNKGVLKLLNKTISYDVQGSLSNIGIKDIVGEGARIWCRDKDVHLISLMKVVGVTPDDSKKIEFDNYRGKPKIQTYSLQRAIGNSTPSMNFRAWCDTSQDKENWKDWDDVSCLNFVFYVERGALDQVQSNCVLIRFAEASSPIVTDIQKLLKKHHYISDEELETIIPLHNFDNLNFIAWNAGSGECIAKTSKGWHIK